jgi:DNA anti-recombination protein RmuC
MRQTLEKKIADMPQSNEQKLEQMRLTVDEKYKRHSKQGSAKVSNW